MTERKREYEIRLVHSMEKVFPETGPDRTEGREERGRISALKGECVSFQIAMKIRPGQKEGQGTMERQTAECCAKALGENSAWVKIYRVECAPSLFAAHSYHDANHLRTTPGMYPDILRERQILRCTDDLWSCFWISVWVPEEAEAGETAVRIDLREAEGEGIAEIPFVIQVLEDVLPKQRLIHTEWFHGDCLADYYQVPVLSERWWQIAQNFIQTAVRYGMNMILTPIFTPPLDTEVGGERTTIQLVGIRKEGDAYSFDFANLERFVTMCRTAGMKYFEMAHLFTQWGAEFTPKIIVTVNGKEEKLFGWHVRADSPEYESFLREFLPALTAKLQSLQIADCTVFHVSDEPEETHLESYRHAKQLAEELLQGFPIMDALSNVEFYQKGIVPHPIPANDHIEPFLEEKIPGLWTYYCCAQWNGVSNRFFSMPGSRTRILGAQLYKYHLAGFLHWGYNFYNSQFSKEHLNPYEITDAGNAFPSGDPFLVYPGEDGNAVASVRLVLMLEAMQDLRALELLEMRAGRERAEEILMEGTETLSFSEYPQSAEWLLDMRERVNHEIQARRSPAF